MHGGQATAEKALLNAQEASNLVKEKQKALNNAKAEKQKANTNYNAAVKEQQNIKAKVNAAKKALQNATKEEQTAKTQADAAQTEVTKLKKDVNSLESEAQGPTVSADPNIPVNTFGGARKPRVRKLKRKTKKARKGKGRYTHRK